MRNRATAAALLLAFAAQCAHGYVAPTHIAMSRPAQQPLLRARQAACGRLRMAEATTAPADGKFAKLLADCKDWGLCRFITINAAGAVLETASPMDVGLKFFEVPGKGPYATLASADKLFECHIRLEAAKKATLSKEAAKIGGHNLYVMRIKDGADAILLSCMLQYDPAKGPGNYFPGAVEKFEAVQAKWGGEASLV